MAAASDEVRVRSDVTSGGEGPDGFLPFGLKAGVSKKELVYRIWKHHMERDRAVVFDPKITEKPGVDPLCAANIRVEPVNDRGNNIIESDHKDIQQNGIPAGDYVYLIDTTRDVMEDVARIQEAASQEWKKVAGNGKQGWRLRAAGIPDTTEQVPKIKNDSVEHLLQKTLFNYHTMDQGLAKDDAKLQAELVGEGKALSTEDFAECCNKAFRNAAKFQDFKGAPLPKERLVWEKSYKGTRERTVETPEQQAIHIMRTVLAEKLPGLNMGNKKLVDEVERDLKSHNKDDVKEALEWLKWEKKEYDAALKAEADYKKRSKELEEIQEKTKKQVEQYKAELNARHQAREGAALPF